MELNKNIYKDSRYYVRQATKYCSALDQRSKVFLSTYCIYKDEMIKLNHINRRPKSMGGAKDHPAGTEREKVKAG